MTTTLITLTDKSIFAGKSSLTCAPDVINSFQACTVGGNSAINAGLYFQPPASDWDTYFPKGWHSHDVQPAIEKLLERQTAVTEYSSDGKHYLQTGYKAAKAWIVGGAKFSEVSINDKVDSKDKTFGRPVYNDIVGQRGGPARTYLQSPLSRNNFHLQTGASVEYIVQKHGIASSVVVKIGGKKKTIHLSQKGRVVVSAGAILSPKVLMYSGIGPRDVLSKLADASHTPYRSSSWVVNPAIGKGLFDNPNTFIELSGPFIESYTHSYSDPASSDKSLYLSSRSGPYSFASQTSVFWSYITHKDGSRTGVQGIIDSSGYQDHIDNNTITLNIYGTSGMLSSGRVILSDDGKFVAGPSSDVYYSHPRDAQSIATFIHSISQALPSSTPKSPVKQGLTPLNIPQGSTVEEIYKYITTPSAYAVG